MSYHYYLRTPKAWPAAPRTPRRPWAIEAQAASSPAVIAIPVDDHASRTTHSESARNIFACRPWHLVASARSQTARCARGTSVDPVPMDHRHRRSTSYSGLAYSITGPDRTYQMSMKAYLQAGAPVGKATARPDWRTYCIAYGRKQRQRYIDTDRLGCKSISTQHCICPLSPSDCAFRLAAQRLKPPREDA